MKKEHGERLRSRMAHLIKRWRASGRTASSFAGEHGITRAKFEYWKTRMGVPRRGRGRKAPSGFVPIRVVEHANAEGAVCEVILASGDRLVIRAGAAVELARGLLDALREGC